MRKAGGGAEIDATRSGAVGVKKRDAAETTARLRAWSRNDQIPELVGEIGGGNANAVGIEVLIEPRVDGPAALRAKVGISRAAGIGVEGFERGGLFDSLTISSAQTRVAKKALGIAQSKHGANAGYYAGAKTSIRFNPPSCTQSDTRNRGPASVEKTALVIAVSAYCGNVFGFELIAACCGA